MYYSRVLDFVIIQNDNTHVFDISNEIIIDIQSVKSGARDNVAILDSKVIEAIVSKISVNDVAKRTVAVDVTVADVYDETLMYSAGKNERNHTTDCGINVETMRLHHIGKYFDDVYLLLFRQTRVLRHPIKMLSILEMLFHAYLELILKKQIFGTKFILLLRSSIFPWPQLLFD